MNVLSFRSWASALLIGALLLVPTALMAAPKVAAKKKAAPIVKLKDGLDVAAVKKNELLDKQFLDLYNRAAQSLLRRDINAGYTLIQAAQRLRPNSARLFGLYGTMYKLNKQYKQAIRFYQLAANGFKEKTESFEKFQALYNIAFCYELQKNRSAAIAAWQIYLTLASKFPQQKAGVAFASKRIKDLASVKIGPKKIIIKVKQKEKKRKRRRRRRRRRRNR